MTPKQRQAASNLVGMTMAAHVEVARLKRKLKDREARLRLVGDSIVLVGAKWERALDLKAKNWRSA